MNDQDILVVGAAGNLGMRLIERLAAGGRRARALVRSEPSRQRVSSFATPVDGDLTKPETLVDAFRGVSRVFIVVPFTPDMEAMERNAIEAARHAGAKRIVYLSNFAARAGSALPPMHIHGLHENLIASLGLEWTVLGPTRYMTSLPFNWKSAIADGLLLERSGSGSITCIDPDEVAEIAARVLTQDGHDGQVYRLSSEDALSAADVSRLLTEALGREVRPVDLADPRAPAPSGYFGLVESGAYRVTDTAQKLLGRKPRSYQQWLRANLPAIADPILKPGQQ